MEEISTDCVFGYHNFLQSFLTTSDDLQSRLILCKLVSNFEKCTKSAIDLVFWEALDIVILREIVEEVYLPRNIQLVHLILNSVDDT